MTVIQDQFDWRWGGRGVSAAYETFGEGAPVLLLPAFSTVSTRDEVRPLADRLVADGLRCMLLDWPGFGTSSRGRQAYGPAFYRQFLAAFLAAVVPTGAALVACGHAAGYALQAARDAPDTVSRLVLLAPTWRGPLPTAMGPKPRTYAAVRALVRAPVIGQALYRLNTHPRVIGMMYRRRVYADAAGVTPDFLDRKRRTAHHEGGRFASVAFVTGALDPMETADFLALLSPPPARTLILCGTATPPKSRASMAAIPSGGDVRVDWVPGSLGLYEENAAEIAPEIARFLKARSA